MAAAAGRRTMLALGVLLAAALLYYSLRGIDWTEVRLVIRAANSTYLLGCAALATVTLFLRAYRWRILLNVEADVSVSTAFWATAAGYFGNNFLPARAGELVRTFFVASAYGLSNAYVLATAISERVADAVALVVCTALVLLTLPSPPGWLAGAARPFAIAGLLGAIAVGVLPLLGSAGRRVIEFAPIPVSWRPRLTGLMGQALDGLRGFHEPLRLTRFLALTAIIWALDAVGTVGAARALGFTMPFAVACLLIAGLSVGSALPATPGYVGIYQFVAVSVLTPFGFSRTDAIAFILVTQALMYAVIGFWGSLGLLRYKQMRARQPRMAKP